MDAIRKFWRDESGAAEAVSSAIMMGLLSGLTGVLSSGLSGIWYAVTNDNSALILVLFSLVFVSWIIFKA